jgi:inward rectifier potassium channel
MDRETASQFGAGREIVAIGLGRSGWRDTYHRLLTMAWRRFFALVFVGYLVINSVFAVGYHSLDNAIENSDGSFSDAFFFSVQTLATIGYGKMAPHTFAANLLVTAEALLGMLGLAVTTGLVFARFSRPTARVLFSRVAVIGPYEGVSSLQFRMANARGNRIVEARLKLTLVRNEQTSEGIEVRRLRDLKLMRSEHQAFALTWTAIHPIDESSPLYGQTPEDLQRSMTDLMVALSGIDEGLSQTIHARHSYEAEDLRWGARFADILNLAQDRTYVDYRKFHETVPLSPTVEAAGDARSSAEAAVAPESTARARGRIESGQSS